MKRSPGHKRNKAVSSKETVNQQKLSGEILIYHSLNQKGSMVRNKGNYGQSPKSLNVPGPNDPILDLSLDDLDHSHIPEAEFQRLQNCWSRNNCTKTEFEIISFFKS